ncbi:MAG: transporter substrate-binding domain-containing protein [Actinomycetota bacterium]
MGSGLLGAAALVLLAVGSSAAQPADVVPEVPAERLTVVMTELEPFVVNDDGDADGFYAEIWDEVAGSLGVEYDVVWVDSFGELLTTIDVGGAEVAVAPLAPTATREASYDFSAAVIGSGPQLGYHERSAENTSLLRALFSREVGSILLVAMIGLVVFAHVIWLVERRDPANEDFESAYWPGVWDGFWWAVVTVTTVGYGDKSPKSNRGRLVALVGMLLSLFLVGAFVSQITSILELRREVPPATSLDDLGGRTVGVVEGTTFAAYVEGEGVITQPYPSQQALFEGVAAGEVDIMVANPFAIDALGSRYGVLPTGSVLYQEFETFGLAQGSPWREPINQALADLHADGEVEEIIDRWLR